MCTFVEPHAPRGARGTTLGALPPADAARSGTAGAFCAQADEGNQRIEIAPERSEAQSKPT
eukprot:9891286-Alexandrium_andersonii.AAC.1